MCQKTKVSFEIEKDEGQFELTIWQPEGEPKAVIQILHGMAEHIDRYDQTARDLCAAGYVVAGHNHKGHGPSCGQSELGYFYDRDGWLHTVEDAHYVSALLYEKFPGKKLVLLGHSMGSFMAREYAIRYGRELSALVLSGTGYQPGAKCEFARLLALASPRKKPAKLVNKIAFSGNNKPFEPARTPFDWLSRDEKQVDKYIADDRCGFTFTGGAFADFFGGLCALARVERLSDMPDDLPVYFMSGDRDPVGQMGKGVLTVVNQFRNAGMSDVTVHLYKDARHELFNELNRTEVISDLIAWLNEKMNKRLRAVENKSAESEE